MFFLCTRQRAQTTPVLVPWMVAISLFVSSSHEGRRRTVIIVHRTFAGDVDSSFKQRGGAMSVGLRWGSQSILLICSHLPPCHNVAEYNTTNYLQQARATT
eukprot:9169677-Pyramimonas_sp.AAC.1